MPRTPDVIMAKSIYDDNELLPEALIISKQPDLKQDLISPDMDRSNNNRQTVHENDDCDGCCDGCCDNDTLLLCCCLFCMCDN